MDEERKDMENKSPQQPQQSGDMQAEQTQPDGAYRYSGTNIGDNGIESFVPQYSYQSWPEAQPQYGEQGQPEAQPQYGEQGQPEAQPQYGEQSWPEAQPQYGEQGQPEPQPQYSYQSWPEAQPQAEKPQKKAKKKVSQGWIPIMIVVAILLGIGGGALGYYIASQKNLAAAQTENGGNAAVLPGTESNKQDSSRPTEGKISDDIKTNATGSGLTPAQIYSEYVNAVVGIASETTGRNVWGQTVTQASSGSGFIITSDGYVITNYHVVERANNVTVQLYDGTEYPATVVGYESTSCDVALLKIDAQNLATVSIGDSDDIKVGEEVCAIGNPLGELTFTLTVGYISALDREINTDGTPINMFQTDAAINSGNSGGPLFDTNGNVIGIATAKYSGSTTGGTTVEGLGFAIPINDVMEIINDLTQYGYVTGKPYLGVTVGDASYYDSNLPAGAYIGSVQSGYAAQRAGLQSGDVIVGVGQTVINSQQALQEALSAYAAGDAITMTIYRNGQYITVDLILDERPPEDEIPTVTEPAVEETEAEDFWDFGDFGGFGWPFP